MQLSTKANVSFLFGLFISYKLRLLKAGTALVMSSFAALGIPFALRLYVDGSGASVISAQHDWPTVLIFLSVAAIYSASSAYRYYHVTWLGEKVTSDLRLKVFQHVLSLPKSFHDVHHSGSVLSQILSDTSILETVFSSSVSMIARNIIIFLGSVSLMLMTSWKLCLVFFCLIPILLVPVIWLGRRYRKYSKQVQENLAQSSEIATEILSHVEFIQSTHQQENQIKRYGQGLITAFDQSKVRIKLRSFLTAALIWVMALMIMIVLVAGSYLISSGDVKSYGYLIQFMGYAIFMSVAIATITESWGDIMKAMGALDRIHDTLLEEKECYHEGVLFPDMAEIELSKVSFSYPVSYHQVVLDDVSLKFKPKDFIAIVGPSGAGKSTLFKILLKMYSINSGDIIINKRSIHDYQLSSLRQQVMYVPQEPVLLSLNLRDNITLMTEVDESALNRACDLACLNEFVSSLPDGYDTYVGERGLRLSAGQRQRVGLARAFLFKSPLVLLDEPTSSIDSINEKVITEAISTITQQGSICVVIAHRLNTVKNADKIIVMNKGQVSAIGSHEKLLENSELYRKLSKTFSKSHTK